MNDDTPTIEQPDDNDRRAAGAAGDPQGPPQRRLTRSSSDHVERRLVE